MPPWFKPEWLDIEEAPVNTWWRQQGISEYQMDNTWLGDAGRIAGTLEQRERGLVKWGRSNG